MIKLMRSLRQPLNNSRGSAIMFSMFVLSLLMFIATEVSKDTVVEYEGSSNNVKRVQAYYAAKACTDLSLLRIKAFQQALPLAKSLPDPSLLDMIWQFPLAWPLAAVDGMSESDKDAVQKTVSSSTIKHQFSSKITGESQKIDINDLGSSSQFLSERTRQQLLDLIQIKLRDQSEWSKKYQNFRFDHLIAHIGDWVDQDNISQLGGDEGSYYSDMRSPFIPPNQPFKTLEELHMVKTMEDEIYEFLEPQLTIYGSKGINVNYAEKDLLMGLDPRITSDVADQIIQRRNDISLGGRFRDAEDFGGFISRFGIGIDELKENKVPLYYDQEINFRISCIGAVGRITREITTLVYDFAKVQNRLSATFAVDEAPMDPAKQACLEKQGEEQFKCLCADKTDPQENQQCIQQKKNASQARQDQGADAPPPPGPPYVIFQDVK